MLVRMKRIHENEVQVMAAMHEVLMFITLHRWYFVGELIRCRFVVSFFIACE